MFVKFVTAVYQRIQAQSPRERIMTSPGAKFDWKFVQLRPPGGKFSKMKPDFE
jgi:hypothetical protein